MMENNEDSFLPNFFVVSNESEGHNGVDDPNSDFHEEVIDTPPSKRARTRTDAPRKNARKRTSCPSRWKLNVAKEALNSGKEHMTIKGKIRPQRMLREGCQEKCNRCEETLTVDQRQSILDNFWNLGNHVRQLDYILAHIKCVTPKTKYAAPGQKGKTAIRIYHLTVNGKDKRVCKKMFLNTLSICDSWINTALSDGRGEPGFAPPDNRGKHGNRPNRTTEEVKASVVNHINSIPRTESHYTRSRSKREYIETGLTIEELYRKYLEWAKEQNIPNPASNSMYHKIFNEEFNIGIFKPKKDLCQVCTRWKYSPTAEKAKMARIYASHLENRNISQGMKEADKQAAKNRQDVCVSSFDLQKVLSCPRSQVSSFFYRNKLSLYNFTIFDMGLLVGTCYMWNETQAKRGANEVASFLFHFIKQKVDDGVKEFIFYSDNPTSQNKNRMVFAMFLLVCVKFNVKITHRFLEPGHTHMEVDSMHARIELAAGKKEIYCTEEWYSLILQAKKSGETYKIVKLGEGCEVMDFKPLVAAQNWETDSSKNRIRWMKVKEISFDPNIPDTVCLKYDYKQVEQAQIKVNNKRGRPPTLKTYVPQRAYKSLFPLAPNKVEDLKALMKDCSIPSAYHDFYQKLLDIGVSSAEPAECSEDCMCCEPSADLDETEKALQENSVANNADNN